LAKCDAGAPKRYAACKTTKIKRERERERERKKQPLTQTMRYQLSQPHAHK